MGFIANVKSYLHLQRNIVESVKLICESKIDTLYARLNYDRKVSELTTHALVSNVSGVSAERYSNEEIVVSLTTHGKRISEVYLAIESIMQGSIKPNRIVLWVSEEYKGRPLPVTLQKQMKRGLEVIYCRDIRSYTKLIPALKAYPKAAIVTIDDDIIYPYDLLENLVNAHIEEPNAICATWIHIIPKKVEAQNTSMFDWPLMFEDKECGQKLFFEGFAGVLYPPNSLPSEVFNEKIFMDICKYADDVWFNAMALKKGTNVKYAWNHYIPFKYIVNKDVQGVALLNKNKGEESLNDFQLRTVFEKYNLYTNL